MLSPAERAEDVQHDDPDGETLSLRISITAR